ncbi:TPA: hypothetical protein HA265_06980 [Candidatus Woesearchaeota archaeon]|nr:hypothetical protein [Candidatus Woesearchaeota archaeon]
MVWEGKNSLMLYVLIACAVIGLGAAFFMIKNFYFKIGLMIFIVLGLLAGYASKNESRLRRNKLKRLVLDVKKEEKIAKRTQRLIRFIIYHKERLQHHELEEAMQSLISLLQIELKDGRLVIKEYEGLSQEDKEDLEKLLNEKALHGILNKIYWIRRSVKDCLPGLLEHMEKEEPDMEWVNKTLQSIVKDKESDVRCFGPLLDGEKELLQEFERLEKKIREQMRKKGKKGQ